MSNKVEGIPCKNCGTTERYPSKSRKFGPCVKCTLDNNKSLGRYYVYKEERKEDLHYRINQLVILARRRAKVQKVPFDIDTSFMKEMWVNQSGRCALSGREFSLEYEKEGRAHQNGPSIDKIKPELGYVKGNVRLVTYQVNTALSNFGDEELIKLVEDIKKFKESK